MYFKKPSNGDFELVAVTRVYVLEHNRSGDLEVRMELADGSTLNRVYTRSEYSELVEHPPSMIF